MPRIALIIGSLRRDSFNRKLAGALKPLAPADFELVESKIGDLPLYNQDDDGNQADSVKRFKAEIAAAQGILFVTPEYNRSVPGVLKNAIDHGSRPYGKSAWTGKPAGIIGVSPGMTGTAMAQQHLRNILAALDVRVFCLPEAFLKMSDTLFDASGGVGEASQKFVQGWMDKYAAWVRRAASP